MTRETKVGVIVATSFLLLVGSVVFYKLYMVGDPAKYAGEDDLVQADEKSQAKQGDKLVPLDTKSPAASARPDSKPAFSDATAEKSAPPPPPEEEPVFAGKKDSRPPALPPGFDSKPSLTTRPETPAGRPGDSATSGSSGLVLGGSSSRPMRPDSGPPAPPDSTGSREAPPPPEAPSAGGPARPGFDVKMPPPAERPATTSEQPAVEEKRTSAPETGRPPLDSPMRPDVKAPPPPEEAGPATSGPRGVADEKVMPKESARPGFPPPGPPSGDVAPGSPSRPIDEARPPMGSDTPVPLSLPPEARGPADAGKKPAPSPVEDPLLKRGSSPPANAFDRTYDPPAHLGKPSADPGQAGRAVPADDGKRGHPVEIREQPEISGNPAPSGVRRSGNVTVYDEERYTARNGDTYASISLAKYGHERYGEALALYNRERNARLVTPQPGLFVLIPPAQILERDYRHLMAGTGERPPAETPPSSPTARRDTPVGYNTEAGRPAPLTSGVMTRNGEKTFRVRTGDTLWNISKQTLGNGERWVEILRMNRDQLPDINRLQDGMILRLPADARVDTASRPQ